MGPRRITGETRPVLAFLVDHLAHASMRPRRCHLGNSPLSRSVSAASGRFNEAPALPPGKILVLDDVMELQADMLQ